MDDASLESLLASSDEVEQAAAAQRQAQREVRRRVAATVQDHRHRAAEFEQEMRVDTPDAGPGHVLLMHMAAREAALAEQLGQLQVQLLARANLLLESPASALKLAKVLKELTGVATAVGGRVESLLATAGVLRAQRALTSNKRPGLRAA